MDRIAKGAVVTCWEESDTTFIPKGQERDTQLTETYCIRTKGGWWCPLNFNRMSVGWYLNHSATPNLRVAKDWQYRAVRNIKAGEELTIDYATLDPMEKAPLPITNQQTHL